MTAQVHSFAQHDTHRSMLMFVTFDWLLPFLESLNPFMAPCLTQNFMCVSSLHNLKSFFTHHFMLHVAPQWDSSQNHRIDNFYKNNYIPTMSWRSNNQHAAGLLVGSCSKQCCQPHDDLLPHSPGIFLSDLVYLST